ncbi:MAG TPA: L,D-transpeptidase [Candidatus Angelobacter sp.]|nr:L,D-transpeptidase [Candidatus Angelobacter sp.]
MSSISVPSVSARSRRRRRVLAPIAALMVLVFLGGIGATAAVWKGQQADLSAARADRASAVHTLDAAVAHAQGDGLTLAQLQPVVAERAKILAEGQITARAFGFDGGERGHLQHQSAAIRALLGRVDVLEQGATASARGAAMSVVDQLKQAVDTAHNAGLDMGADKATLDSTLAALQAATSPKAVSAAMIGIPDRIAAIQQQTQEKLAADAALSSSREAAQLALARGDRLATSVQQFPTLQPTVAGWLAAITAQHDAFNKATDIAGFDAVSRATKAAADNVDALLTARSTAYSDMGSARQSVQDAIHLKVDPGDIPSRLDALQPQLDAAVTTPGYQAVDDQINGMMPPLLDRIGVAELGVGRVIVVSLARQELTAYEDGKPFASTLVTTGRPALPTPPGNYTVLRKNHPWKMTSDFPPSSPYYYPPTWVQWTLWFRNDGYAIHDAPWRGSYGPGTESAGSHGCVNVPMPIMETLFNWADVGTRVIVH